jgi:5-methylcytosine-specific restriction endonuclease McrA
VMHIKLITNLSKLTSINILSAMHTTKLTIELVPKTSWYSNVRSNVSKAEWDSIRKKSYENANHVCEVCGDVGTNQGYRHKLECHEIWQYDDEALTQTLTGLVSLCPYCHLVKHPGLAQMNGKLGIVLKQLQRVNQISVEEAGAMLNEAFEIWRSRSKNNYTLDISFLETY